MVSVDVKEFSANSPLDYAELNKLVLAIKTIAAAMPEVKTTAPATGTTTATVTSAPTILTGNFSAADAKALVSGTYGSPYTVPYTRDGKPVTFATPPFVVAWASTGGAGSGLAIVNKAGNPTETNFNIRVGWVSRSKNASGNVSIAYIAIGNEVKA